jgi:hypothetical protein
MQRIKSPPEGRRIGSLEKPKKLFATAECHMLAVVKPLTRFRVAERRRSTTELTTCLE